MARVERRTDGGMERRILIGLLTDTVALARIARRWQKPGFLKSPWANLIADWCVEYHAQYQKAPGSMIQAIYEMWASTGKRSDDEVQVIGEFLGALSDQYETLAKESNTEYVLDLAAGYFDKVMLQRLREQIDQGLEVGQVDKVLQKVTGFRRTDLGKSSFVDILRDEEVFEEAFTFNSDPVITFDGPLGEFWGDSLERDGLVSIMAPSKRFKSACLLDLAVHGLLQRRKVAFFQAGDLSRPQIVRRFMARFARRPWKKGTIKYPRSIKILKGEKYATVVREDMTWDVDMPREEAKKAFDRVLRTRVGNSDAKLFLSCHSAGTLSVSDMVSLLEEEEKEGWAPDVVVVDYADILAPSDTSLEKRDQINDTWLRLRALSSTYHCLVLTATQTNADSYRADTVRKHHFSDDRRKSDHVTGMVSISMTDAEKEQGILRHLWTDVRERQESRILHVAGCRALVQPYIHACWGQS